MIQIQKCPGTFVADIDEIRPQYTSVDDGGAVFSSSVVRSAGVYVGASIDQLDSTLTSAGQNTQLATPRYSGQVLPFDVTLSGANEYGAMCAAKIYGLEILNEGWYKARRPFAAESVIWQGARWSGRAPPAWYLPHLPDARRPSC